MNRQCAPHTVRSAGILLHPTSLPGSLGSGDLGAAAYHFVDWLHTAGQSLWQTLPLTPPGLGNSPYMSRSVHAYNPMLISPAGLVDLGLLDAAALREAESAAPASSAQRIDFAAVGALRSRLLHQAGRRFLDQSSAHAALHEEFQAWCKAQQSWLGDFALYMALAEAHGNTPWVTWPEPLRRREPAALRAAARDLADAVDQQRFEQWMVDRQWQALRAYAAQRGVRLVGDAPIFCAPNSADVWANPQLFKLDAEGAPRLAAGVPPDYFSATGQLWGNPVYDWPEHARDGFAWWRARMRSLMRQADVVRIDHFRGIAATWEVPATARTALEGRWQTGPGDAFFAALRAELGNLPIIAEDLGIITPDVVALREAAGLPGMAVLQFAFSDGSANLYLPHNLHPDCVVYTGTHDNDTTRGWFQTCAPHERDAVCRYLETDGRDIAWDLIRAGSMSVARLAIVPLQDVLDLGSEARMNIPGVGHGHWGWRFDWAQVQPWHAQRLRQLGEAHGRVSR